jgi:tape measure domain-containing protein
VSHITFTADLDQTKLLAGIKQSNRNIEAWVQGVEKQTSGLDRSMQKVGAAFATYFSARALMGFGQEVINVRGQFQQLSIAFETMLGNKDKADKLMAQAIDLAAKTPFTLVDVASNIKQLMAMGIAEEKVMDTMKSLGDVAAGVSVPISRVATNYGQVATMGRLMGRELRDFAMAGIPLTEELAKNLGKTKNEIQEMVTAGQIGFPEVEKAFQTMAGEGGKFYNLMEKQNKSVTGQISNLTDKFQVMLNEIGTSNEGIIYSGISGLGDMVANYQTVIDVLKGLVLTLGAVKVATIFVAHEQKIQAAMALLTAGSTDKQTIADARWIVMQERKVAAQKALNKSMLANPYVLAAAAIAALGYGIYKLITYETDLEKAIKKTDLEIENEKDKVLDLFAALKTAEQGTDKWEAARKKIIDQYGDLLPDEIEEFKNLNDITKAQDLINKSLEENIAVRTRQEALEGISADYNPKIVEAQKDIVSRIEKELGAERAAMVKQELAALVAEYKAGIPGAEKALLDYRKKLASEIGEVTTTGLAVDLKATKVNSAFLPLIENLRKAKSETDLANGAFEKYMHNLEQAKPKTQDPPVLITAAQQRVQLMKQLAEEEKKLKELQSKPGTDPLGDIKAQEEIIKGLKEQLDIKDGVLSLDEQLEAQTEKLRAVVTSGNDEEIRSIAAKIVELQKELDLKERLVKAFIERAEFGDFVPTTVDTSRLGLKSISVAPKDKKQAGQRSWSDVQTELTSLRTPSEAVQKRNEERQKKINKDEENALQKQIELRAEIASAISEVTYMLTQQMELDEDSSAFLQGTVDSISQAISGNYIGAALSMLSGAMALMPSRTEKFNKKLEYMNSLIEEQNRLVAISQRAGGEIDARQAEVDALKAKRDAVQAELDHWEYKLRHSQGGVNYGKRREKVDEYTQALIDAERALQDAMIELEDTMAGGVTQNTIADALSEAILQGGKEGTDGVAEYMNDVLLNAITDIFKKQILLPLVNDQLYPIVTEALGDGIITDEEARNISKTTDEVVGSVMKKWNEATKALDLGDKMQPQGLSGAIQRTITEDTGTELAGLMRKISDDNRMNRDYNKQGVDNLIRIEANTFQTVVELKNAVAELRDINTNTKPVYSGLGA